MINQVYRLVSARQFEVSSVEEEITDNVLIIRPTYLSICHADQRYYTGTRGKEAMAAKLPMSLIHEGIGEVILDPKGEVKKGTRVVMVPNTPIKDSDTVAENYLTSSKFRSSGYDGYMQEYVYLRRDRAVILPDIISNEVAAFSELISVAMHATSRMYSIITKKNSTIGIWGDGNLGFITSLILSKKYPDSKIVVFGKHEYKLNYFSFVDNIVMVDQIPSELKIDYAFECVGGAGSRSAIEQIISCINPQGGIALMGVSENPIEINTRMILERGLTLVGSSRSGVKDFQDTVSFLEKYPDTINRLSNLVGIVKDIKNISDATEFFEADLSNSWGKSIMKWSI